jgi:hypothetical protein
MNTFLADMLNKSSISNMQISVQRVHLTLSELKSVDTNMDHSVLCEICTACKSVATIIVNDLLADNVNSSSSDSEDVTSKLTSLPIICLINIQFSAYNLP